jgi:hypothetical protein
MQQLYSTATSFAAMLSAEDCKGARTTTWSSCVTIPRFMLGPSATLPSGSRKIACIAEAQHQPDDHSSAANTTACHTYSQLGSNFTHC